jgi:tripartite-type tricarboxylate transporter receptor subunit TctC
MPSVPTVAEVLPGFRRFIAWWAIFGPADLPAPLAERLSAEVRASLKQPEVETKLNDLGLTVVASTPLELATTLKQDVDSVGKLVKRIGLQPE